MLPFRLMAACALIISLSGEGSLQAQEVRAEATLVQRLKAQATSVQIDQGHLKGEGAERLNQAAKGAQFVFIGEDHGIREIAAFSAAWFESIARQGYTALAVENGPAVAEALGKRLREADSRGALARFDQAYPFSVAFYGGKDEADVLARVAEAAGPRFELWGFDQELMGAGRFLLSEIAHEPLSEPAKTKVESLRKAEAEFYQKAAVSGNPTELFMMAIPLESLRELEPLLKGSPRAQSLLQGMLESRSIYEKNMSQGYESNLQRARLMKRTMQAKLDADPHRKVLIKVGALHAYRGVGPLGSRELGNFLAEHAEGHGASSLHVMVLAAKGKQAQFAGIGRPSKAADIEVIDADSPVSGVRPLLEAAQGSNSWSLFDLRMLRPKAKALAHGDIEVQRLLEGYDFVLLIPEGTPEL